MAKRTASKLVKSAKRLKARIRHAALTRMPIRLTGGRAARNGSIQRLRTVEREINLPDLAPELDGLRIAHLSDMHIGDLVPVERLDSMVRAVQELKPDLIAITGDLIDLEHSVLEQVSESLLQLKADLGVHIVLGNHDHLVDGQEVIDHLRRVGLTVHMNEHQRLEFRGRPILLLGIDYAPRARELQRNIAEACRHANRREPALRLLLSHHPDAFEAAQRYRIDLTLAGHTHGGQLVLMKNRSRKGSVGLGSLTFRYPGGLYRKADHYLYVTSGFGSWFPLRVNCPPEIACLVLKSRPDNLIEEFSHPLAS
ncbi:MAG: metallophosphoesterase [Phycisphaeraceae bacterium]|nr:metallophosphoesterase [Phycisphaeraceae bacterium]